MSALLLAGALAFLGPLTETGRVGLTPFGLMFVGVTAFADLTRGAVVNVRDPARGHPLG